MVSIIAVVVLSFGVLVAWTAVAWKLFTKKGQWKALIPITLFVLMASSTPLALNLYGNYKAKVDYLAVMDNFNKAFQDRQPTVQNISKIEGVYVVNFLNNGTPHTVVKLGSQWIELTTRPNVPVTTP